MSWITTTRFPAFTDGRGRLTGEAPLSADSQDLADTSDELLLSLCANGDHGALTVLFRRYYGLLRTVCVRILRDEAEADDLVQDVFLSLRHQAEIFDSSKSSGRSWIVQMAYRRALSRRRYLTVRGHYQKTDPEASLSNTGRLDPVRYDSSIEALLGRERVRKVLAELTTEQYRTLRLHFYEGYTLAEISRKLGQSLGNIRHHYYRGLEKFRKQVLESKLPKP
jgi:RNA polymerase sigma-70 factor (ECF subfamily)